VDCFNIFGSEDGIKDSAVFAVVITYHMGKYLLVRLQVPNDPVRLLQYPSTGRMRCNAGQMNPAGSDFNEKEDVQCLQAKCLNGEKIIRQKLVTVVFQKRAP
jgi:hypothetical protein